MTWTCCGTGRCRSAVRRGAGAVHAGVVPALVHLGERAAAGAGEPAAAGGAGPPRSAAARPGRAGLRRHRLDAKAGLRAQKAGRRVRAYQDPGQEPAGTRPERAGRHDQHAAGRAGDRRPPGCAAAARTPPAAPRPSPPRRSAPPAPPGAAASLVVRAGLGVLLGGVHRRCAPGRGVLLGHRADGPARQAAIAAIPEDAWTPISYPRAIWDDQLPGLGVRRRGGRDRLHRVQLEEGARPSPPG